ncbi:Hypothetical protein BSSP1_II0158 [Brucella suis bv. 2]|nr:Hypothetical protein BSPT2_II0159 [Brucella suis bv. 2]AIB28985.1 Hypothetical protein BSSP1_II0158 [Brucella suis bv. 2]
MVLEIEAACFFVKEDCRSGWRFLRGTAGFPACFGLWRNAHSTLSGPIWGLAACCSSHVGDNDRKRL